MLVRTTGAPGQAVQVTPAWLSELQRVIELDPHTVGGRQRGVDHPPAGRLPGTHDGASDGIEAVRVHLHRLGYVCKRPTWSLKRKSTEQARWVKKGVFWHSRGSVQRACRPGSGGHRPPGVSPERAISA